MGSNDGVGAKTPLPVEAYPKAGLDASTLSEMSQSLYSAAISDALDLLGYRHQVMHRRLRPLMLGCSAGGFVVRARTVRWIETDYAVEEDPYGLEIDLMDTLEPGDVLIHSTDLSGNNTPWGELMSTVAKLRGAVGCVCDSNVRDCAKIIEMGFPVYYAGIRALDSKGRGRVQAFDVPVRCGDVLVQRADVIFADFDGVVVIPDSIALQVFELAQDKVKKEQAARNDLKHGKSLRETYEKYKIL
jgi:regulator of RNase E activity RraA